MRSARAQPKGERHCAALRSLPLLWLIIQLLLSTLVPKISVGRRVCLRTMLIEANVGKGSLRFGELKHQATRELRIASRLALGWRSLLSSCLRRQLLGTELCHKWLVFEPEVA